MSETSISVRQSAARPSVRGVILGGALAGILDILAAFAIHGARGISPVRVLQAISSGIMGSPAFQGGVSTASLGLLLHFCIATTAALVYGLAARRFRSMIERPLIYGPLYGIIVYLVMTFVVVPLSAVPKGPFIPIVAAAVLLAHILCVGLPIAWALHYHAGRGRFSVIWRSRSLM